MDKNMNTVANPSVERLHTPHPVSVKLNSQERILAIIKVLSKNHYSGLRVKELSKILKTTETNICRDIAILESFNFVEKNTEGKIRLSVEFASLSHEIAKSYKTARLELSKEEERYLSAMV